MTNSSPDPAGFATAHAFDDELGRLDALATAELVRAREVSPAEVVRAAIERAKAVNPSLDAVACEDYDRAIERAEQLAPHGTFAGVPTFIKDMTDVAGLPTRNGSDAFAGAPPAKATMAIAQQLFDMGTGIPSAQPTTASLPEDAEPRIMPSREHEGMPGERPVFRSEHTQN